MTNVQIIFAIFIAAAFPTATALVGILMNRTESTALRSEMQSLSSQMSAVRERLAVLETKSA